MILIAFLQTRSLMLNRQAWIATGLAATLWTGFQSARFFKTVRFAIQEGVGYHTKRQWFESPNRRLLAQYPWDVPLISNAPDLVYLTTHRFTRRSPRIKVQEISTADIHEKELERFTDFVKQFRKIHVIWFKANEGSWLFSINQLETSLAGRARFVRLQQWDGIEIFQVEWITDA